MPLVIDPDPDNGSPGSDIDDALAVALGSPEVDLLGVTTVAGNVELAHATTCAVHLLKVARRTDIPVCLGAEQPLVAGPAPIRAGIRSRGGG